MTQRRPLALLFGLACLAALILPALAHAGPYYVITCHGDGINTVFAPNGTHYGAAYTECPGGVAGSRGLVVRNVDSTTPAPAWSHARLTATAPPGTYIDGIKFIGQVYANSGWVSGLLDAGNARWVWCGPGCGTLPIWSGFDIGGFATHRLDIVTMCSAERCNRHGMQGGVMLKDVTLRLQDVTQPTITGMSGPLVSGGWQRGVKAVQVGGSDNAGVRVLRAVVDGSVRYEWSPQCDSHFVAPCPTSAHRELQVETDRFGDGRHAVAVQVEDIGGNVASTELPLLIDNTPPEAVQTLTAGSSEWRSGNSFAASWTNPPSGTGAPIAAAAFQLCPDPGVSKPCQPIQRASVPGIKSLDSIRVPSPGRWNLRVWLSDAAGNENAQTYREVPLRWDPEPPSLKFLPRSEDDPTRISIQAADLISGIATAELEVSRGSNGIWHSLPTEFTHQGFSAVVDDESLPPGSYALRARARDHAGNERSVDGMTLRLPIRLTTELAVGKLQRLQADRAGDRRGKRVLVRKPRTRYGRAMKLSGRLVSPGGNALADRDIEVTQRLRVSGKDWIPVATVRTNSEGRFTFKAPPGPSRLLRFRYPGSATIRGQTSIVDLRVRATSSLRVNRKRVVNGEAVTFRGTVSGEPLPAVGKLLQLQVLSRGDWLTFATPRADPRGNWSHDYRFTATRGVTRYRFRVRLPREAGYPYESGTSKAVKVKVVGL